MTIGHAYTVNIRDGSADLLGDHVVRVDRAHPVLGNHDFRIQRRGDPQERERVLALHKAHVERDISQNGPISQALDALAQEVADGQTIALQCWCAPLPCHGDLYVTIINDRARQILASKDRQAAPKP